MVIEPIQGEGGFIVPAPGFLPALSAWARTTACVFIADEIQTGFCRTGDWFACDDEGVVPDLITLAKGIAGGLPLAAVTGRAELMDAVHVGGLGGTYGGNPVACAAGARCDRGDAHPRPGRPGPRDRRPDGRAGSASIAADHPVIGDIRGRGAMMAIELTTPGTLDPRGGAHGRGLGVLPPAGRRHPDLRHLGQRVPVPAAALDLRRALDEAFDVVAEAFAATA